MRSTISMLAVSLAVVGGFALQGCGGSGGGSSSSSNVSSAVSTPTVSGTAAYGAPMAGAAIVLTDVSGTQKTATAGADGSYSIDVSGLKAPFLITATGQSGDETRTYSAIVTSAPAVGVTATVNVTPITTAIVALASSTGNNPGEFSVAGALAKLDTAKLAQATTAVKTIIADVTKDLGVASFDPVSTPFTADLKSAGDKLLETVKVTLSDTGVTMTNALAPVVNGASGAAATITVKDVAKDTVAALPKSDVTATAVKTADDLLAQLRTQLNACLALAPADRVSPYDSTGVLAPTTLKGACTAATLSAFDSSYKASGKDLLGIWGPRFRDLPQGATVGQAEIIATFKKTDGSFSLSVRLPVTAEGGGMSYSDTLISDASGSNFKLLGNQRKYSMGISARFYQFIDVSANPRIGNSNGPDRGKNVGKVSRYEAGLSLNFDPSLPVASKVYAVRIKGPALPAAGLVLARSVSCGSGENMNVYSSDGSLPDATGKTAAFAATASTTNVWRYNVWPISGAYTGTDLWNELRGYSSAGVIASSAPAVIPSTPTNYAPTQVDVSSIPELAAYTFEVFSIDAPATPETFTINLTDKPRGGDTAFQNSWPTLTAETLKYMDPTIGNAKAAPLTNATIAWTADAGAPLVTSVSFSGNARDASNVVQRYNLGDTVRPIGAKSRIVGFTSETDGLGAVCSNSSTPILSSSTGSRSIQTRQSGNRIQYTMEYSFNGRDVASAPATKAGGDGWNIYTADVHPIVPGAVTLANGLYGQFSLATSSSSTYLNAASVASGVMSLDTTVNNLSTDRSGYYLNGVMDSSDTYPKTLTLIARVAGNSSTTQRVLDLTTYWIPANAAVDANGNRVGISIPITIRNNTAAGTGGVVSIAGTSTVAQGSCVAGGSCSFYSSTLDTSASHVYQIVITLDSATSGTVTVYVDGGATPILTKAVGGSSTLAFNATTTSSAWTSQLQFGDLNTGYQYKSSLDWMIWQPGAFTPAQLSGKLPTSLGVTTGY